MCVCVCVYIINYLSYHLSDVMHEIHVYCSVYNGAFVSVTTPLYRGHHVVIVARDVTPTGVVLVL